MNLQADFRIGFVLFLVLIFSGLGSYVYSTQVTYPVQTPVIQYSSVQQSQLVLVYNVSVAQSVVGGGTVSFGPWNANSKPFDIIAFNFAQTSWNTYLTVVGARSGVIYYNVTDNQGLHYIGVYPNDTYTLTIENLNPSQPLLVMGTIDVFHTEYYTQQVPITTYETVYQTLTEYPYHSSGSIMIFIGVLVGIGTAVSVLQSRRRMKKIL